jgi:hypothetical protein
VAVADDLDAGGGHGLQGGHGLLGPVFLDEADDAFRTTMARITAVSLRSPMTAVTTATATRTRTMVLANCSAQQPPGRLTPPLDQLVGANPPQAVDRLGGRQAGGRVGGQRVRHRLGRYRPGPLHLSAGEHLGLAPGRIVHRVPSGVVRQGQHRRLVPHLRDHGRPAVGRQ